ncbi:S49 family peptidase [Rhabdochlamydiaceae symbiont of Dictyostelium giganteum]|uniref:S49 family peptidase n=1 Tax=Rhabdochlamydiaceae symbiont of Dictyostelium giganteum TaxID=3342349 RepID=UPI00384E1742
MQFIRESIFASTLRLFCRSVALILGIGIGVIAVALCVSAFIAPSCSSPQSQMTLLPDAEGNRELLPLSSPAILCIDIQGVIGVGDLTQDKINNILLDSRENLFKNSRVKAILLKINTPGGSSVDSDAIYQLLMHYKAKYEVPVYAYVSGLCASGGMYIACAADKIYASRSSVIGSVGVILGPNFNFSDVMTKYGIQAKTFTAGQDKDELNPFRPWKPDEGESIQSIISVIYDQFISTVSASRPLLTKDLLINTYGAHIFAAPTAETLGYVDNGNSSYIEALKDLVKEIGLSDETPYQVVKLSTAHSFFNDFGQSLTPAHVMRSVLGLKTDDVSLLQGQFLYYYQP